MRQKLLIIIISILCSFNLLAQIHPDAHYEFNNMETMFDNAVEVENIVLTSDKKGIKLTNNNSGYIIFEKNHSDTPFNEGLPSWNGFAPKSEKSSFKIQMRFPYKKHWSPWVTVGFWKNNIWTNYGSTKWSGGTVDIDIVNIQSYIYSWQFKVIMKRSDSQIESPILNSLSFFVSDSKSTDRYSFHNLVDDRPEPIFIETEFINQYKVDKEIGSLICSPTIVSTVIRSFNLEVDPLELAKGNLDPYWKIFGVWPRSVQNGSQYGLTGSVTRYRNWIDVREVLNRGGRVAMSVGQPLYPGHLMMLAGFDKDGNPIVHDPAKDNGYSYIYSRKDLSDAWFRKGGISYTFYLAD